MSKITFRADDDLVRRIEALDASKSEIMRDALREYLDRHEGSEPTGGDGEGTLDALVADRVDALLDERLAGETSGRPGRDVNVNITVDGAASHTASDTREPAVVAPSPDRGSDASRTCAQCGENVDESHVYCPNCGEKASRRLFCECGDEIRTDWAFCPGCGRRTPSADVLDRS